MPEVLPDRPFAAARDYAAGRRIAPAALSSAEWAQMDADTRAGAVFSAGVMDAEFLQLIHERTTQIAAGVSGGPGDYANQASVRSDLKELLALTGYRAAPEDEGTIKDLSTDARLNLILRTQTDMVLGYGAWRQSFTPGAALIYPCAEFKRLYPRAVPRGWRKVNDTQIKEVVRNYWQRRWAAAGGRLFNGRMIARIDDPVWVKLSRFGHPWDPCDFNTGFGRVPVPRSECLALGVIAKGERVGEPKANSEGAKAQSAEAGGRAGEGTNSEGAKTRSAEAGSAKVGSPQIAPTAPIQTAQPPADDEGPTPEQVAEWRASLGAMGSASRPNVLPAVPAAVPAAPAQAAAAGETPAALLSESGFPRLINVFTVSTLGFIPAIRDALVARLRGLFRLQPDGRLVPDPSA